MKIKKKRPKKAQNDRKHVQYYVQQPIEYMINIGENLLHDGALYKYERKFMNVYCSCYRFA